MKHIERPQTSYQTITPITRQGTHKLSRILTGSLLTLTLASTTVVTSGGTLAASRAADSAAMASHRTSRTSTNSKLTLIRTINGFGYAAIHGPDAAINSYATPALLAKAPSRHLINLFGPAQNPPPRYTFTIDSFNGSTATVTVRFLYGPSITLTDRMTWVATAAGWKIADITYIPDAFGLRALLYQTCYTFGLAIVHGTDAKINSFATRDLLKRAPSGHLVNLFGLINTPQQVAVQNIHVSGHTASANVVFIFNPREHVVRASEWQYTSAGWKLSAIGGYGRG